MDGGGSLFTQARVCAKGVDMKRVFVLAVLLMVVTSLAMAKGSGSDGLLQGAGQIGVKYVDPGGDTCSYDHTWHDYDEPITRHVFSRTHKAMCYVVVGGALTLIGGEVGAVVEGYVESTVIAKSIKAAINELKAAVRAGIVGGGAYLSCGEIKTHPYGVRDYDEKIGYRPHYYHEWDEWNSFYQRCETHKEGYFGPAVYY